MSIIIGHCSVARCRWDSIAFERPDDTPSPCHRGYTPHTTQFFPSTPNSSPALNKNADATLTGTRTKSKSTTLAPSSVRTRRTSMGRLIRFLVGLPFLLSLLRSSFFVPSFLSSHLPSFLRFLVPFFSSRLYRPLTPRDL